MDARVFPHRWQRDHPLRESHTCQHSGNFRIKDQNAVSSPAGAQGKKYPPLCRCRCRVRCCPRSAVGPISRHGARLRNPRTARETPECVPPQTRAVPPTSAITSFRRPPMCRPSCAGAETTDRPPQTCRHSRWSSPRCEYFDAVDSLARCSRRIDG